MRRWAWAMLVLAGPAAAQGPKGPPPAAVEGLAALPAELAGWRRSAQTDFEQRPGGIGLGASVEYRPAAGGPGVATVYLYDRGRADLTDGAAGPDVAAEIRAAVAEVESLGPLRRYVVAARPAETDIRGAGGRPGLHCLPLVLALEGGRQADSFVCLGIAGGKFVKLRMTLAASAEEISTNALTGFGEALLAAVQPPVPAPPPTPGKRSARDRN